MLMCVWEDTVVKIIEGYKPSKKMHLEIIQLFLID